MMDIKESRKQQMRKASKVYRTKNIDVVRNKERKYKMIFREFQRLRNIELF